MDYEVAYSPTWALAYYNLHPTDLKKHEWVEAIGRRFNRSKNLTSFTNRRSKPETDTESRLISSTIPKELQVRVRGRWKSWRL